MKKLLYIGNKLVQHGLSPTSIETLGPLLENEGYVMYYASTKKNIFLRMMDMIWKTIRLRNTIDAILIDTYSTSNFYYALIISQLARVFNIRYVPILHGGKLPERLKKNPVFSKLIFEHAYKNSAPSHYLKHFFEKNGFNNVIYIPNSIEINQYEFLKRKIEVPNLLWVRSFAKIYNPNMAIEVYKTIKKKYPLAKLCMVGPEKDGSMAEAKALAHKYSLDVKFTGRLSKEEWTSVSKDYNIFINTTHFDNTPVSIIEALALGLPVITTNVGGIPYLLEHNVDALLVDDNATEKMTEAIIELCELPHLAEEIIINGRIKAENFDWDKVKKLWKDVF